MAGTTENHNIIVANIIHALVAQMKGRLCLAYSNDLRIRIEAADAAEYPDVVVLCGERQFHDDRRDVLRNPSLIIEVLSPSTEAYDRGEKFAITGACRAFVNISSSVRTRWPPSSMSANQTGVGC